MNNTLVRKILIPAAAFLCGLAACLILLELSLGIIARLYVRAADKEIPADLGDGSRTIVACIGDSYTEGGYTPYQERYPAQLQRMFDAAGEKVRVINYGVCESNSTQVYRRFARTVGTRRIDYAVLLVGESNRFNFVGFNDSPVSYYLKELRVSRLAHVFGIYVRDRLLRLRARRAEFTFDMDGRDPTERDIRQMALKKPKDAAMLWTRYYMTQGRFSDALRVLDREVAAGNRDPMVVITKGECFEGLGDNASAERMYRAAVPLNPGQGYLALGQYYARRGAYGPAERFLRGAVKHNAPGAGLELGGFLRERKRPLEAEAVLKRAGIDNPPVIIELLCLYAENGRYAEADALYDQTMIKHPEMKFLAKFALTYYMPRGQYAKVLQYLLKALDQETPPDMSPFFMLTSIYQLQSESSARDVLAVIDRAAARHPFLARDPTFRAYRDYFRDIKGWEQKREKWLMDDLEKIAALCRRKKIALIVLNYPVPYATANATLETFARRHNLPFIEERSQFAALIAREGEGKYLQEDHNHCTTEGYRIMAENVFKALRSLPAWRNHEGA